MGHGNFRFAQFLTLNTRFKLHLICLFAHNHRGLNFCQIASIMIFNFLNSSLWALILKVWIMITLFYTCLFHWWIWSSRSLDICMTSHFFPPNLHAPCIQGTDFSSFSCLDLILYGCSIYVFWIFALVIFASLHDCVSYFTFIVLFQHIQIMCVWFLFQFLIFIFHYFEFYVVVNVKVNMQNFLKLSRALHGLATSLYIIYYI